MNRSGGKARVVNSRDIGGPVVIFSFIRREEAIELTCVLLRRFGWSSKQRRRRVNAERSGFSSTNWGLLETIVRHIAVFIIFACFWRLRSPDLMLSSQLVWIFWRRCSLASLVGYETVATPILFLSTHVFTETSCHTFTFWSGF
ncbi:hypothetical protein L207DRAFT_84308 [Hyaloscypha variabilis F]|uniref:Uncharacterized protein n=1 Tax=Hyaloscypha variabilis (strain UAMH 11265 / GT02V1 / F) TaxID=1149755 RepID=A0A2J6RDG1_HYAVF|nr:hypothetical protein L207DRAFT_84308 [Hyaloscypha variabilis F]